MCQSNHEDGSFAEHVVVKDRMFIKVPDHMSMSDAATIGVGVITVGQVCHVVRPSPGTESNV